jgi:O-antigen/teichoic acid export membrane protein
VSTSFSAPRRLLGKIGAPVISQGLNAGTSLMLQVIAARALGLLEYGVFALLLSLLVSVTALFTGYVGDSLAVLDRHDPPIRAALANSAVILWAATFAVGTVWVLMVHHGQWATALVYAAMLVAWLMEETFRRLLIARMEFWKLVANDAMYLVGTVAALGAWYLSAGRVTLTMLLAAMAVGAGVAVATGFAQVPSSEVSRLRQVRGSMREVAAFAGWRSLQAALRPTALLLSRLLVANLVSLAAVGVLEAGRLVIAPLQVIINGAGSFLLAGFAAGEKRGDGSTSRLATRAAYLLTAVTVFGGGAMALFAGPLGKLMTKAPVDPWLLLGWVAYLGVWAASLPYVTEVVARKLSRAVFVTRLVDSVAGLALAGAALLAGLSLDLVPWLMGAGGLYSLWRLRALALRTRPKGPVAITQADLEATVIIPRI